MLNYKFNTYETKAYVYCASMGKPVLVQPLGEFDTRSIFYIQYILNFFILSLYMNWKTLT